MMNKNECWLGCDVGKETFTAALADAEATDEKWARMPWQEFEHSKEGMKQMVAWLKDEHNVGRTQLAGICIEATGCYSELWMSLLGKRLGPVSCVNPVGPKRYREMLNVREKTDRVDAAMCALFGRARHPEPTVVLNGPYRRLREQHRCYVKLAQQHSALQNRLECVRGDKVARKSMVNVLRVLERELKTLDAAMQETIDGDETMREDARRAMTITSVGARTVQAILGEFGDLRRYNRDQLVALAGLFPKQHSSGTSVHKKPRLAKGGGARVRKVLYMAAMNACTYNPHLRDFAARLINNGKTPMSAIGAVMRKLLLLIRAVVVSGKNYDSTHGREVYCETT